MSVHYKIDLYTKAQLAKLSVKLGDLIELDVPQPDGSVKKTSCLVKNTESDAAGTDPNTGEELTRVMLTLENQ
jgi:hypothetical protein